MTRLGDLLIRAVTLLEGRRSIAGFTLGFAVFTAVAAFLSGWGDFLGTGHQLGWWGLIGFALLTGVLGMVTAVGFSLQGGQPTGPATTRPNPRALASALPTRTTAPSFTHFAGRREVLDYWLAEYADLVEVRKGRSEQQGPVGPMILAIHGPAGVGKSALAWELARQLLGRKEFDGLLVASFGAAATARGAADISRDLLRQLGWPEKNMPPNASDRASLLRSRTHDKRLLFVFDAVRDHDQVRSVMPSGAQCVVIVVSRREIGSLLGIPPRPPLSRPHTTDAVTILSSLSGIDWISAPETAVEVVDFCGRLPLAMRAAAELARDRGDLRWVAHMLHDEGRRLGILDYGARNISTRLESEFDRLTPTQREAMVYLSNLDSRSFVPWVLRPLLDLRRHESTTLVRGLEKLQLIERIEDDAIGQPRYRVDPLARLYAHDRPAPDAAGARARLDQAYLDLIDEVLALRGDGYSLIRTGARGFRSPASTVADRIHGSVNQLVRHEYLNLVRVIEHAPLERYAPLVWRVAAVLDGRVPALPNGTEERVRAAFVRASEAAEHPLSPEPLATVDVQLGLAQFLIAIEKYVDGLTVLGEIDIALDASPAPAEEVLLRRLRVARIRAWAYVQADNFAGAQQQIKEAEPWVHRAPRDQRFLDEVELLRAFGRESGRDVDTQDSTTGHGDGDIASFRAVVDQAGQHRRARHWLAARRTLLPLLRRDGDLRGRATVLYQLARVGLDEAHELIQHGQRRQAAECARAAAGLAAECAHTFDNIGDEVGQIRARCLASRALALTGGSDVARIRIRMIQADFERWSESIIGKPESHPAYRPLLARVERAYGEVELALGDPTAGAALDHLTKAVELFRALKDTANYDEVLRVVASRRP